ncbi:MAG TPA: ABC transporter permease subunit [Chloroflexota bacterium]|nr:ABC transporter permease subunit [Chloroflexota bacterium]
MKDRQAVGDRAPTPGRGAPPTWWLVCTRELTDLWVGGKALILLLIFGVLMGIMTFVLASNSELSLIPPKEMVYETLKIAIAACLFMALVIGADGISGERERSTLEALLLTPTSRRQLVVGKFLAYVSPWPAAFLITVPYVAILSQGDDVLGQALLWGAILGTILVPAYAGLGTLVSFCSTTNRTSYFVSLGLYVTFLVPAQLPGHAQTGAVGQFLQWVNPMAASSHFLSKTLVNNRTLEEYWPWLTSPVVFATVILAVLFVYAAPGLRLEGGRSSRLWALWQRATGAAGVAGIVCLIGALGATPALAHQDLQAIPKPTLDIAVDMDYKTVKAGDSILFKTTVTNAGPTASVPLIVAMNIINLDGGGDPVDPEDWSPQRAQYIEALGPGRSASNNWRVNAILDGNFLVYLVVIPEPEGEHATSWPVASPAIHLTVTPFTKLNPVGVLPYAIGLPIVLLVGVFAVYRWRQRAIDAGASA